MLRSCALRTGLVPASGRHRKPGAEVQIDLKIRKRWESDGGFGESSLFYSVTALHYESSQGNEFKFVCIVCLSFVSVIVQIRDVTYLDLNKSAVAFH